jgi:CHAT domain-containing protein/Tfp pilus assembly protein PilF
MMKKFFIVVVFLLGNCFYLKAQSWLDVYQQGNDAFAKGDYENAVSYIEKSLVLAEKELGKDHKYCAKILKNLGFMYGEQKNYEKAETCYLRSLEVFKKSIGILNEDYLVSLYNLAGIYEKMLRFEKVDPLYNEVVKIQKEMLGGSNPEIGTTLNNIAQAYNRMGRYAKAEFFYIEALAIKKKAFGEMHPEYASVLNNLGRFYKEMGRYAEAESLLLKTVEIRKKILGDESAEYANSLENLAGVYLQTGNYNKAEELYVRSIGILAKVLGNNSWEYANGLNSLGQLYEVMYGNAKAISFYMEAERITKISLGTQNSTYCVYLNNLASAYAVLGRYDEAELLFLSALEIDKKMYGMLHEKYATSLNNLAELYRKKGQYNLAEPMYLKVIEIMKSTLGPQHSSYESCLNNAAVFYWSYGNYSKADLLNKEAVNILYNNIEQNFSFLSEIEKEKYIARISNSFEYYHSFDYSYWGKKQSIGKTTFDIRLATDGMILDAGRSIRQNIKNSGDTTLIRLNQKWEAYKIYIAQQYSRPIAERDAELKDLEEEANRIEKELTRLSTSFADYEKRSIPKFSNVKQQLKQDEAIIEFISFNYFNGKNWSDSTLYIAMVVRKNDTVPVYIPLFEEKQLKGLFQGDSIRTFANLLYTDAQVRTEEHDISYGDSLYQLIWRPIESTLKNIKHIYYSPSGLLYNITFDAVPMKDGILLSDKYNLRRLSSTANILRNDSTQFNPLSITLFGGIQYDVDTTILKDGAKRHAINDQDDFNFSVSRSFQDSTTRGGFSYLAGSKMEVDKVEAIFKNNNINTYIYTGAEGTEEEVKNLDQKKSTSILHFSTHGFFFPDPILKKENLKQKSLDHDMAFKYSENPLFRSGLIMAGAEYVWKGNKPINGVEDGILTAYEVSNLYLSDTKLVVLSACETGLGDIKGSEGVYGLQRSFKMAGVDYIIVTLWQVLDKETSEFMILFYQNLLEKKSIPGAFKTTQDTMKNKYRDEPYKWAGFVLIN